ncbi:MAG: hypothetical protein HEQ23_06680 [Tepidisphaera sp.]
MRLVAALFSVALGAGVVQADVVTVVAGRDNTLFQDPSGLLSNGAGPAIFAGVTASNGSRRGLMSFKVQDFIPAGSVVTRAELTLYADRARGSATPMGIHRLLASWGEGTSFTGLGGGVDAERGDATWTTRFFLIGPEWTTPGGDFVAGPSALTSVGSAFRSYTWSGSGMVADVQRWVNNPDENFGWILKAQDELLTGRAKRFVSREGDPENRRPRLLVEYTPPPPCLADFNGDGFVDFFDYSDYVLCFESAECPAGKTADFNGDDFVDFFDYSDYVVAFEAGC